MFGSKKRIKELEGEVKHLKDLLAGDVKVHRFKFENGQFDASFSGSLVHIIIGELVNLFRSAGGENYLSLEVRDKESGEPFEVLIQRCRGVRPAERARKLDEKFSKIKDLLQHGKDAQTVSKIEEVINSEN